MRKIICITGPDGSGKSSLISSLTNENEYFYVASVWDILKDDVTGILFSSKMNVDEYLCSLTPDSRLLFLAHAMKYSIDKALNAQKHIVIDSYYYKYFASELALGASNELVQSLKALFIEPQVTIFLQADPSVTVARKAVYSRYECGLLCTPNEQAFFDFQFKTHEYWNLFISQNWHIINAHKPEGEVLNEVLRIVDAL